jgi:hypothetical protein
VVAPQLVVGGDTVEEAGDSRDFEEGSLAEVGEDADEELGGQSRDDVARGRAAGDGVIGGDADALVPATMTVIIRLGIVLVAAIVAIR